MPPLRERREDIPILVNFFTKKMNGKEMQIDAASIKKLENYYWPGNIRQLMNVVQRAIILSDSNKLLPDNIIIEDSKDLIDFKGTMREFEILLLKKRLEEFGGNRTLTAKSLDVSVRWIQMKLKELGEQ